MLCAINESMIQKRNPWFVFFMIIITIGIYFFVWVYKINNEMKKDYSDGPSSIMLLIFFLIPFVGWLVMLKWLKHIKLYQEHLKYKQKISIFPLFLLSVIIFNPITCAIVQNSLNKK
jgi:hypothetical protein